MSKTHFQYILKIVVLTAILLASSCNETSSTIGSNPRMEIASEIFPLAIDISEMEISRSILLQRYSGSPRIDEVKGSSGLLGYCVESKVVSRSGPFRIRVLLDPQLYVKQATVISYPWDRGRDVCKRAFTSQFERKGPKDPIQIGKDIDAMTGATTSSRVMTEGVRDAIKLIKLVKEKQLLSDYLTGSELTESTLAMQ